MTTDEVNTETVVTGSTPGGGLIGLVVLLHLAADLVGGTLPALLALLGHRFALSTTALAMLVAVSTLTSSLAQPAVGGLADRFGARRVAVIGIALDVTLMALVPLAPNAPLVFALVAVGGLGSAALHPAINALARAADPDRPAVAVSLVSAGGTVGVALAPITVLTLLSVGGAAAPPP